MSDLISRADAIEAVMEQMPPTEWHRDLLIDALSALPSAEAVSREKYDTVCEEYNRLVHNAICRNMCDENCKYEKGNTCYHAREHYAIDSVLSAEAVPHGRLIDADSLISDLEEWKENPNNDDSAVDLVNHFIGIIKTTPSAEAVQWIPCSERLPDVDVEVLATVDWGDVRIAWLIKGGAWETDEYMLDHDEILAWMPLPKPYKGGDDTTGESL